MPAIPETPIQEWAHLLYLSAVLDVGDSLDDGGYLFRGHAHADWPLRPTLHRAVTNDDPARTLPDGSELLRIEKQLTDRFRNLAPLHMPPVILQYTKATVDWWTVMRHHGAPTRLLDWTGSFFVAVYFAVCSQQKADGVVYAVHVSSFNQAMQQAHATAVSIPADQLDRACSNPDAPDALMCIKRYHGQSDRMIAQQGGFMLCQNVRGDVESILATELPKAGAADKLYLRRFRIPSRFKPEIMSHLRTMNVAGHSLFPGLDGVGRFLDEATRFHRKS
jgi:hypothetical protein